MLFVLFMVKTPKKTMLGMLGAEAMITLAFQDSEL